MPRTSPRTALRHRTVWQRQADRSRRLVRFGRRHKAGLLGWTGIIGVLACSWAFTGATQAVTVAACGSAAVGGAAIRHHQRNRTVNSSTSRRASAADVRAHHDAMLRTGRPAAPQAAPETVTVKSHSREGDSVKTHTRRKPGAA